MYLLYEFHRSPSGEILVTDMLCSTWFPGGPGISWKSNTEKAVFELVKGEFKKVALSQRSYDPDTKIWSFIGAAGKSVHDSIKNSPIAAVGVTFQAIDNLAGQAKAGRIDKAAAAKYDPNDFFYTPNAPVPSGPSKAELKVKLAGLLEITGDQFDSFSPEDMKKFYRKAALRYHPDRNSGDSSRMTELNYLWQVYTNA